MRTLDRILLSPWIQRASAAWFIAGVLIFGLHLAEEGLKQVGTLNVIGVVLMFTGLVVFLASWLRRRFKAPTGIVSDQVDGLPLFPPGRLDDHSPRAAHIRTSLARRRSAAQGIDTSSDVDSSRLHAAIFGEEQKELQRRAQQIATENVDREEARR